ncbi:MAG: hypothetical protein P4L57_00835 [Rhizomicrobium sp.]|nr:hypothetical protein [Rhizomicrobium sp.]
MKRAAILPVVMGLLLLSACGGQQQGPTVALPPPPPKGEPSGFIGMTATQLRANFGVPSFSRRENGSELWRYDNAQCRTFFFLYPTGRDMGVRHVETVPHNPAEAADPTCLAALRAKRVSPAS